VLEPDAAGRDLLVSARTGSGKTVAYGLAFARDLLGDGEALPAAGEPLALVIAPTRELALQVQRELQWLYADAGAKVTACVGGMDPRREQRALASGAHIVVGTPGRLRDHLERGQLSVAGLKVAVLDEADEMLDLGFREELEAILDAAAPERRTLLFSATLPRPIIALAGRYQQDALRITVAPDARGHADIDYRAIAIAPSDVEHTVVNLLRYWEAGAALVFCSTRESVRKLHASLVERGFSAVALSGELTQGERSNALQALRDRRARVCVATDVAARGIDIPDLELVIHAELANDAEALQHRSGRTGRAGRKGVSVLLAPHPRRRRAEALLRIAKIEATWGPPPSAEDIRARDQARLLERLKPAGEAAEEDLALARELLAEGEVEQVLANLVRELRAELPAPEDLVDSEPEPRTRPEPRAGFEDSAWFRIRLGRNKNADPRWLLPMICRRGHVTRREIGAIRIYERETQFEIARAAADRFTAAIAEAQDQDAPIEALAGGPEAVEARERRPMRERRPDRPRPARDEGERKRRFKEAKPWAPRPEADRPERAEGTERPAHERKPQPKGAKPWAARAETDRPERVGGEDQRPYPRPAKPRSKAPKPWAPRAEAGDRPVDARKPGPKVGKPWAPRADAAKPDRAAARAKPKFKKAKPNAKSRPRV
jgi:ATP-dependent RNA helicase DeaD